MVIDDLADYLLGSWRVQRTLSEGGEEGSFAGTAAFARDVPSPTGEPEPELERLSWDERGQMRWRGNELQAYRRLALVRGASGWEVRFDDDRPFHPIDLAGGVCSAVHPCGEDFYEGEYRILDAGAFDVLWRVRGPRKDQRIVSRYRRD